MTTPTPPKCPEFVRSNVICSCEERMYVDFTNHKMRCKKCLKEWWTNGVLIGPIEPEVSAPACAETPRTDALSRLRKKLKTASAGQPETWGFVALFMEMIDEVERESALDELTELTALRAEAAALRADRAWQPIATAPKNGEIRIIIARFRHDGELADIDFDAILERESESWEMPQEYRVWKSAYGRVEEPTHWMPLPTLPQ